MKKVCFWLEGLQQTIENLSGWNRHLLALSCGVVAVAALPPLHFFPALIPAFTGLLWLLNDCRSNNQIKNREFFLDSAKASFATGWWFGVGFFLTGLYWISFSFLVDAKVYAWMIPFALLGLSMGFAVFIGLSTCMANLTTKSGATSILMLAIWWTIFEWVRSWIFTGFPWNLIGTVWSFSDSMIQFSAVTGVYGLGLFTVLAATVPAILGNSKFSFIQRTSAMLVVWIGMTSIWVGGEIRLANSEKNNVAGVRLRLVQPNIPQQDKWNPELRNRNLLRLINLSQSDESGSIPTHIIWPETAVPLLASSHEPIISYLSNLSPKNGALLAGVLKRTNSPDGKLQYWNSLNIITQDGQVAGTYDKSHLVPFGEYVPFRKYLNFSKLTFGDTDFSAGKGRETILVNGAPPVSPLICFEAIFPGNVVFKTGRKSGRRPGWLLNLSNDAWFGKSSGPYQHFAAVKMRAVEEGLPLVRVSNTGISAVVDAYGRIREISDLNKVAVIDSPLPSALEIRTIYSRFGNWAFGALILIILGTSRILLKIENKFFRISESKF
jgi:apolipoprotein N-acyltransferase